MTLINRDLKEISEVVKSITGYGVEDIQEKDRSVTMKYHTKVLICHYLSNRGYTPMSISPLVNRGRANIYYLIKKHDDLMFADSVYRRCVEDADKQLKQTT